MESRRAPFPMSLSFIDRPRRRPQPTLRALWALVGILLLVALLLPVRFGMMRLGMVTGALLFWAGGLYLFWKRPVLRVLFLAPAGLAALLAVAPGRPVDQAQLRSSYLEALQSYAGTPYVWGGETHLGIDCSGLIRSGMMEACLTEGVLTANADLIREAAAMWWFDSSAKALGEEYQGRTRYVFQGESLNELDYSKVMPGDVAVTSGGAHTLAYLGNKTWIESDPGPMKVVAVKAPSKSGWFVQGVRVMRWSRLDESATALAPQQVASAATK